jgi:AraC-like DNA-binding protein
VVDPLADFVALLQPTARHVKIVTAAGPWRVSRSERGGTFYGAVLEGRIRVDVAGRAPLVLGQGDFVLIPDAVSFVASSPVPPRGKRDSRFTTLPGGHVHHGEPGARPDVRLAIGRGAFESPDAALLVSLLPEVVHVRGEPRLTTLLSLVTDEARAHRPGREVVLTRLLEVVLLEALRSAETSTSPGLIRGLADERVAVALRAVHGRTSTSWTVASLAKEAGLSRSAFFERFVRAVGTPPMEYLLGWRMALARRDLERGASVAEVASRSGYGSASAFSVAFSRHVGQPPKRYASAFHVEPSFGAQSWPW